MVDLHCSTSQDMQVSFKLFTLGTNYYGVTAAWIKIQARHLSIYLASQMGFTIAE